MPSAIPEGVSRPLVHYSHGVLAKRSGLVVVAGQVVHDGFGTVVGNGDIELQTRQAMRDVEPVLSEAGATWDDVVMITIYDTDVTRHGEISRRVRDELLAEAA